MAGLQESHQFLEDWCLSVGGGIPFFRSGGEWFVIEEAGLRSLPMERLTEGLVQTIQRLEDKCPTGHRDLFQPLVPTMNQLLEM